MGALSTALSRAGTYRAYAREVAHAARCAAWYPLGMREAGLGTGEPRGDSRRDTPIILVHGYGHNRSGWLVLEARLRKAGFTSVHTLNYLPTRGVASLAARLAGRVEEVRQLTGHDQVHLVGHSLGGILVRWYVQELGGHKRVDTAITVATPHGGTLAAWVPLGRVVRDLRPGSPVLRQLASSARPTKVRWIALYSNVDAFVIPARSAQIRPPALGAENILVRDHGHLSTMVSRPVADAITSLLELGVIRDTRPSTSHATEPTTREKPEAATPA